jgi:hypothetical protein
MGSWHVATAAGMTALDMLHNRQNWLGMDACSDQRPQTGTASSPAAETMKRMRLLNSGEDTSVDRRIVVKLLTTYFERGQPPDVLQLMARMLGFSGMALRFACQRWPCLPAAGDAEASQKTVPLLQLCWPPVTRHQACIFAPNRGR